MNKFKFGDKVNCIHGIGLVSRVWFDCDLDTYLCEVVFVLNNQTCNFTALENDLTPAADWVKCSERMPELGVPVLVIGGSTALVDKAYDSDDGISFYEDNYGRATHWMPLPTPPQD